MRPDAASHNQTIRVTSGGVDEQRFRWLALSVRDEEAAGSYPATPTRKVQVAAPFVINFVCLASAGRFSVLSGQGLSIPVIG